MSKDPAFLFYPGDYLRDTQCLSEKAQVAYDRIMCEHMRNICISQAQLNFFTKRLTDEEKAEVLFLLTPVEGGFQIEWIAESISKRKAYSESRSQNRTSKKPKKDPNTSLTYDPHMENAIENENEDVIEEGVKEGLETIRGKVEGLIYPFNTQSFRDKWEDWKQYKIDGFSTRFLNLTSEQAALMDLSRMAKSETEAIAIIDKAMASNWKHLHEKDKGSSNTRNGNQGVSNGNGRKDSNTSVRSADRKNFIT